MEPQKRLVEPFYFSGSLVGCLLIHGFSGSPSEMRYMGERLAEYGWTVLGILLSGHGTNPEHMAKTRWEDWVRDAEEGVRKLRESCDTVVGIGLSMGGLLALHLATLGLIDGIVSMNAPMVLADKRSRFVRLIRPFKSFIRKSKPSRLVSAQSLGTERFVYSRISVDALISLNSAMRRVRRSLYKIQCPTLLMQSIKDFTVNPISVQIIRSKIQQIKPDLIYWEKSGHILTLGPERQEVVLSVHEYLRRFN
jgi:carboxylesterase